MQLAYILLYCNSFHSFCHICSIALTAVQPFQKYTATCTVSNLAVRLHISLQLNTKVQAMVHTCCVADAAARQAINDCLTLWFAAHFLQPGAICLLQTPRWSSNSLLGRHLLVECDACELHFVQLQLCTAVVLSCTILQHAEPQQALYHCRTYSSAQLVQVKTGFAALQLLQ